MSVQWTSQTAWLLRGLLVVGAGLLVVLVAVLSVPSAHAAPGLPALQVGSSPARGPAVAPPGAEASRSWQPLRLVDDADAPEIPLPAAVTRARPELGTVTRESPEQPALAGAVLPASAAGAGPALRAGVDGDLVARVGPPQLRLLSTRAGP